MVEGNDYASQTFLQWFVAEQVEEEKNAGFRVALDSSLLDRPPHGTQTGIYTWFPYWLDFDDNAVIFHVTHLGQSEEYLLGTASSLQSLLEDLLEAQRVAP